MPTLPPSPTPRLLIDGYNLLFQSNVVGRGRGPGWLQRARERLLSQLRQNLAQELTDHTYVIFDANNSPLSADTSLVRALGMTIRFAREYPDADELLEEYIRVHPHPKTLQVISSDRRVQQAALRRKATVLGSEDFLDQLLAGEFAGQNNSDSSSPSENAEQSADRDPQAEQIDAEQVDFWLREFGD